MTEEKDINEMSWAYQLLDQFSTNSSRWFKAWLITFIGSVVLLLALGCSIGYIFWIKGNSNSYERVIDLDDIDEFKDSTIKIGDDKWEGLE